MKYIFIFILLICYPIIAFADTMVPEAVDFYGNVSVNGNPAPIGTIIQAFDSNMVMCGSFTVGDNVPTPGIYGSLHVSNDWPETPGIDEGADPGDSIYFKINGIWGTPTVISGGLIWTTNGAQNNVDLAMSSQTVSFNPVFLPNDTLVAPGWSIKLKVGVENTGNGIDFYGVNSFDDTAASPGWSTVDQDTVSHANVGDTAYVYFDVDIPVWGGGGDTAFVVHYTVYSHIDTTVKYADSVVLYKSETDVDDNPLAVLPGQFSLKQNYPNPFNPTTVIAYNLPYGSELEFEVINILGQVVESRSLGFMPAGEHELEFDASGLTSGIYFYRLSSANYSSSKKMMLLK